MANLMHLEAMMMKEHYGLQLSDKLKPDFAEEYLGKTLWLYTDWGALAKLEQLKQLFEILVECPRNERSDTTLSSFFCCASGLNDPVKAPCDNRRFSEPIARRCLDLGDHFYIKREWTSLLIMLPTNRIDKLQD
jgi:hypothetical protein